MRFFFIFHELFVQVTNCFETPGGARDQNADDDDFQLTMMRNLRDVNIDSNAIGWYQSACLGNFLDTNLLETMFLYQESLKKSVVIIFDPLQDTIGKAAFKAFRLRAGFLAKHAIARETHDPSLLRNMPSEEVFQEIPISIHNSLLVESFILDWKTNDQSAKYMQYEHLDLENETFLEKNMHFLLECLDDLSQEQQKLQYIERQAARMKARISRGEAPESDADSIKRQQMPSQLETLLISNQIQAYCKSINTYASDSFGKLFLVGGFEKAGEQQLN